MSQVRVPVRVLPSGKVYRQMFDAEVQLVRSLQDVKASKVDRLHLPPLTVADNETRGKIQTNLLSERQKVWMTRMPNDYVSENPVNHRQITTDFAVKELETEVSADVQEVCGLSDVLLPTKRESKVIKQITERRKQRHNNAIEQMNTDLSTISNRIEPRIVEIGETLLKYLEENDKQIECIFKEIESDDTLVEFSLKRLNDLWKRIESNSPMRKELIKHADDQFSQLENERKEAISAVFRKYLAVLENIAYFMPSESQKFLEKESMMVNQSILANRRAYAKMKINLLEKDLQREMVQQLTWHERVQDWKKLNAEIAVKQFAEFMENEYINRPPEVNKVFEKYVGDQKGLQMKRKEMLEQLREFKPPSSTKSSVYKWNYSLAKTQEDIDQLNLIFVRALHETYENVCQRCLDEIDKYRQNLLLSQVCSEQDIQRIVNDHMLPLVGQKQRVFEKELEHMDQMLESLAIHTEHQLKLLFKYTQGAAHLWDVHEIRLAKQEQKLQKNLDDSRQNHDVENQERESKLDIVLDRLRQESTEEALTTFLAKSQEMLDFISLAYDDFHEEQLSIVSAYPDMVRKDIQNYDDSVCKFFSVDRNKPKAIATKQVNVKRRMTIALTIGISNECEDSDDAQEGSAIARTRKKLDSITDDKYFYGTLFTSKGTSFYITTVGHSQEDDAEGAEKEIDLFDGDTMPRYIENIYIEPSYLKDLKNSIRMQYLNHLETWLDHALTKSENVSRDKREELESELDLRRHLHEPRAKRIEVDVHNVRAAELVLHQERVSRHCKGIAAALVSLKQDFEQMVQEHDQLTVEFQDKIEGMEDVFMNATKSIKLQDLITSLHNELNKYMQVIKASLRNFRQCLDTTLSKLRDSNAQCLISFKLFSQGGNFSPEETVSLRKKLEKMSQRVDAAEGVVMHDLEGMESKRLEQVTDVVNKFEDRFSNHMIDLMFIEKVQRWVTNSQVRIKTEVAQCNAFGVEVARHVTTVKARIDAFVRPNMDKENVTTDLLSSYANEVMDCLHKRATYFGCKLNSDSTSQSQIHGADEVMSSSRLSHIHGITPASSSRQMSQGGSRGTRGGPQKPTQPGGGNSNMELQTGAPSRRGQAQEDAAIGMIKSILRTRKGAEHEYEDLRSVMTGGGNRQLPSTAASQLGTRMQKGYQRQTALVSTANSIESEMKKKSDTDRTGSGGYKRRETKFDARHMVFGTKSPQGIHFEARIQQILYETLDGLLSMGELYYKQKGSRPSTRPDHIQENFDQFSEVIVSKLLSYDKQTKDYLNKCLQDFRQQLKALEEDLSQIPELVLDEVLQRSLDELQSGQKKITALFRSKLQALEKNKEQHKFTLRPTMGHPDQSDSLEALLINEKNRHKDHVHAITSNTASLTKSAFVTAKKFLHELTQTSASLLEQYDHLLTIDDVLTGTAELIKESTSVLIRRKAAGLDLLNTYQSSRPQGPRVWPGLEVSHFLTDKNEISELAEELVTRKTVLGHESCIRKRYEILTAFTSAYDQIIKNISQNEEVGLHGEEKWVGNWLTSVENVRKLYV